MSYLQADGAKIFYEFSLSANMRVDKKKNCVTLINGLTRSCSDFKLFAKFLRERGFCVLIFDNRGAGQTECSREFSLDDIVKDIQGLWAHEGIERSHVLGISLGGYIAQMLAIASANKISSLCLVSTSPRLSAAVGSFEAWGVELEDIEERLRIYVHKDFHARNGILLKAMAKKIAQDNARGGFDQNAKAQRQALSDARLSFEELAQLKCATLILHGDEDRVVSLDEAHYLHSLWAHSKLEIFKQTGHLILLEQSAKFYPIASEFFLAQNS